jgi:putative hydrolase of the HAD superfamily
VLWDADGVLQVLPGFDELWRFLSEETRARLLADTFGSDMPDVLSGRVDMGERVDRLLLEHGLSPEDGDAVRATWTAFPPVAEARTALDRLRRDGVLCVLATNQDTLRETHMRPVYDALMDRCYYSCSVGLAKPDAAFFRHIADDLGLDPDELLFIDDRLENVEGARAAGLHAEVWHHEQHVGGLEAILTRHGLGQSG